MNSARAIVAGHADFAAGLLSAVLQITGRDDIFLPMTNRGLGAQDVERLMADLVGRSGAEVIFTDLPAGSCTMAARRLQRQQPDLTVVTGTNLAALLDFLFAESTVAGEAARLATEKGRASLLVSTRPTSSTSGGGPSGGD